MTIECPACGKEADVSAIDPGYARCLHCQTTTTQPITAPDPETVESIRAWVSELHEHSFGGRQTRRLLMLLDQLQP